MIVRRGIHLLRHSSTLQSVTALSSAEAEFYALTKGAAYALGTRSYFRDWQTELTVEAIWSDSSSGLSFSTRRGLGKMRHIHTRCLWLQDAVAGKTLRVAKVKGESNPADVLTKAVPEASMMRVCTELGQEFA